ncbi:bifunctional glutamate N-acetyltransferase/amino-acid acetyltransferase ArgJ [Weissella cibaria]|uniref:bifunctional glutamate N-acetyltransferase/amino-acid acetyltransferase ArgJ n=1 Tax=Weissella cibaria TaxID=137591 RepID=UPI00106E2D67|nr:bifunctional glutamate N-acetyltransferase/amino-acid acetyltransferase ArgJ [Weissella cibaria]MBZ5941924.1 bifunctional glutamate N-acetyltransferase/amino-acid acetyltransferase ArgJ [Weissella cibaria]MCB5826065.1 bifunctional glutamate N-acetyltransferase/amino-acid acetyltransferase ArgJ [Weissella cibaria]MCB5857624.1 bifunctional glutamate N-acetyltransferase/amino-acid acetyltransferase ArgJ [Weissella cibaria]MCB5859850.1 bifunctional glutamate N-acetyltransferase/amino-acid acetyl
MTFSWPKNFYSDGIHGQLRRNPTKPDLGWLVSTKPAQVAGVFTRNTFPAAPVQIDQQVLRSNQPVHAIFVNSANANAFTGATGLANAYETQKLVANKLHKTPAEVLVVSTGIIGEQLPMEKIRRGIERLQASTPLNLAKAMLTTDTTTKTAQVTQVDYQISGVAKGSGMIHPNMGTMLGFIATDVTIKQGLLQQLLRELVDVTFNQITIDGDTSTNDTVLVLANGDDWQAEIKAGTAKYEAFKADLHQVLKTLAIAIASDGEGATRLIDVRVIGARHSASAQRVAKSIVGSNLVKTAVFGADPNWGRIIDAIGNVGEVFEADQLSIAINQVPIIVAGHAVANEVAATQAMQQDTIVITVDLGLGTEQGQAWGSDLTYEYVHINAAYHT